MLCYQVRAATEEREGNGRLSVHCRHYAGREWRGGKGLWRRFRGIEEEEGDYKERE